MKGCRFSGAAQRAREVPSEFRGACQRKRGVTSLLPAARHALHARWNGQLVVPVQGVVATALPMQVGENSLMALSFHRGRSTKLILRQEGCRDQQASITHGCSPFGSAVAQVLSFGQLIGPTTGYESDARQDCGACAYTPTYTKPVRVFGQATYRFRPLLRARQRTTAMPTSNATNRRRTTRVAALNSAAQGMGTSSISPR